MVKFTYLTHFMKDITRNINSATEYVDLGDPIAVKNAVLELQDFGSYSLGKSGRYTMEFCCLDIETTSINVLATTAPFDPLDFNAGKTPHVSYVYSVQLMIGNKYFFSRNPADLTNLLVESLNYESTIPLFIHFSKYEFNNLLYVLAPYMDLEAFHLFIDSNYPIKLRVANLEIRCTYAMTNLSLDTWTTEASKTFDNPRIAKAAGTLDYHKYRDRSTPLTDTEMEYSFRDVYGMRWAIIGECIKWTEHSTHIREVMTGEPAEREVFKYPASLKLTATGNVRGYIQHYWSRTPDGKNTLRKCSLTEEEYEMLHNAFRGGDVQASYEMIGKTLYNLFHYDFASAYPAEMVNQLFPLGKWNHTDNKAFISRVMHKSGTLFCMKVKFRGVSLKLEQLPYLSESKCEFDGSKLVTGIDIRNCKFNGRVVCADELTTTLTDCDFRVFKQVYDFGSMEILDFMYQQGKRLPVPIVKLIMEFYRSKTTLKGVDGMEAVYLASKQLLNAIYGCSAMALERDQLEYNENTMLTENTGSYKMPQSTLPYNIAPWVTGYVREHLNYFKQMLGADCCMYSDTDSIFCEKTDWIEDVVAEYNENCRKKLIETAEYLDVDPEYMFPKTIKGETQVLGAFDKEDDCDKFITLGAKRYVTECNGAVSGTIAGLSNCKWNKKNKTMGLSMQRIADIADGDAFKAMELIAHGAKVTIEAETSGKKITQLHRGELNLSVGDKELTVYTSIALVPIPTMFSMETGLLSFIQGINHASVLYGHAN